MPPSFKVRCAEKKDMSAVCELIHQLAIEEGQPNKVEANVEELTRYGFGDDPCFGCLVAECDEEIVGYTIFSILFSAYRSKPVVHLEDIFVGKEHRRKGIGEALLAGLVEVAKKKNACRISWLVFRSNEPAIQFYRSLGADVRDDLITMRLEENAFSNVPTHD